MILSESKIIFIKLCLATSVAFMFGASLKLVLLFAGVAQPRVPSDYGATFYFIMLAIGVAGFLGIMFFSRNVEDIEE